MNKQAGMLAQAGRDFDEAFGKGRRKKCTNCGKSFSTELGLTSLCGDCEDSVKEGGKDNGNY